MPDPLPAQAREFDLATESAYVRRKARSDRIFLFGVAVFLAALGVWFVATPSPNVTPLESLGVAALLWTLAAFLVHIGTRIRRPSPLNQIRLQPDSIRLRFDDRLERSMAWSDPEFGLSLFDYSRNPQSTRWEGRHVWVATSADRGGTVPQDVLTAIVAAAQSHGVPILVRKELLGPGRMAIVTRLGRPEATPGWNEAVPFPVARKSR